MDLLQISLASGWSARPVTAAPDVEVRALMARFRLRLGDDGVIPHLPMLPVAPRLLELCRGLTAVITRVSGRVVVPLTARCHLSMRLTTPALQVTLTAGHGAPVLDGQLVPAASFIDSVVQTTRAFIDRLKDDAPALAATALIESLAVAATALASQQLPEGRPAVADEMPEPEEIFDDAIRLAFAHDGVGRLTVCLGKARLQIEGCPPAPAAAALVQLVRDAIATRDWPLGQRLIPVDAAGARAFGLVRGFDGLALTLLDGAQQPLCAPHAVGRVELADAAWQAVRRMSTAFVEHTETLIRLLRWARALDAPLPLAAPAPPEWRAPVADAEAHDAPLPVSGLHHLHYRRAWRREAPGLLQVSDGGGGLLVYDGSGLTALSPESGAVCWEQPGLRPLTRFAAGVAVDALGRLTAFDDESGTIRWRCEVEDEAPVLAVLQTPVGWIAQTDVTLFGLSTGGERRWRFDAWYGQILGVCAHGPLAWCVAEDGHVHGIRVADGAQQFVRPVLGEPDGGIRIEPEGLLVASTVEPTGRGALALHDPVDGRLLWRVRCDGALAHPPCAGDGSVVVLLRDGDRFVLEARALADGALRWRHARIALGAGCQLHKVGDLLCLKSTEGEVSAVDIRDGTVRWGLPPDDVDQSLTANAPPIGRRGIMLVPGVAIRVVDPSAGRLIQVIDCGELMPGWMHVWPNGDLVIAEDQAVVRYALGGHLALVGR
ncbi:MAG: outer membrane protein assembly factor BamB [Bradymonadia bacterium]|jgi:outer membrane protein assembly factor BamB